MDPEALKCMTSAGVFYMTQINGQRIYEPQPNSGIPAPPRGTELFVGRLPKTIYEDVLLAMFSSFGAVYRIRLMLDFSGETRGFAFVTFYRRSDALQAIQHLNNSLLGENTIIVMESFDNRRLYIGRIPKDINAADVKIALRTYIEGMMDVFLYRDRDAPHLNRGYAFIEFETHAQAAIARRKLSLSNIHPWGRKLIVNWADPIPHVGDEVLCTLTRLYVSNIPVAMPTEVLVDELNRILEYNISLKVHKEHDYAFLHFGSKDEAQMAYNLLVGKILGGNLIHVEWARPREFSKKNQENCKSFGSTSSSSHLADSPQFSAFSSFEDENIYLSQPSTSFDSQGSSSNSI